MGDRRGEEVGKKAKSVLADLPYHKTQRPKQREKKKKKSLILLEVGEKTQSYCTNTGH